MNLDSFQGPAYRLKDEDIPRIGDLIGVGEDEIHAIIDVEARGSGFDNQGRPAMLFEPHVFYRQLKGPERAIAVREGLAYRRWKRNYPKDSYPRLIRAIKINETAALNSASWGMGQIMGFNHLAAGFKTVQEMVSAFSINEACHIESMVNFIKSKNLDEYLRRHDWRSFARGYNGSSYAKNDYHTKLAFAFAKWSGIKNTLWQHT